MTRSLLILLLIAGGAVGQQTTLFERGLSPVPPGVLGVEKRIPVGLTNLAVEVEAPTFIRGVIKVSQDGGMTWSQEWVIRHPIKQVNYCPLLHATNSARVFRLSLTNAEMTTMGARVLGNVTRPSDFPAPRP